MAGKAITRGSRRVARVVDKLSKNTLADLVLDKIAAEIGEDATDEQVLAHLQPQLNTIARIRGDKAVNLASLMALYDRADEEHRRR